MKSLITTILILSSFVLFSQENSDETQIRETLNNYIDGFYKGDTLKLKQALKPRLCKFGYWKNKDTQAYEYSNQMTYEKAIEYAKRVLEKNTQKGEDVIRKVEILDIGNHIAAGKITAWWGIDYALLSKESNKWMIEQVIWEGPLERPSISVTEPTTYYLIRHAEKDRSDKTNRNPDLTEKGKKRAENWANYFKDIKLDAIYSTDYNRTKQTATPTAEAKNLELNIYDPSNIQLEDFISKTQGKTVLIVGHSNTTPMFANGLIGEKKYDFMSDDDNASLYVVELKDGKKESKVLKI